MDFDLQRVKQYEMSSQLLVFGYGRGIHADAANLILYTILAFYHLEEYFDCFDDEDYTVDDTKMTLTKKRDAWTTAYGRIPMLCDGAHRDVYHIDIKVLKYKNMVIGIDEGRKNMDGGGFWGASTHHYALHFNGDVFEKGIDHELLQG